MSWPMVKLKDCCEITMGQAPEGSSYNENGDGLALIAGAGDFGISSPEPKKFTTQASKVSRAGDLILCIRATIGDLNWSDKEYCLGRGVSGLRPKKTLDANYLWYFIKANKEQLASKGTGSTFKQVSKVIIGEWELPLPPLAEQKRIAAILDKADAIRRKRQQAIQLADDFLRAVFLEMFGDPVTNPKGWEVKKLGEIVRIRRGASPRPIKEFLGGTIPWIKIGDGSKGDQIYLHDTKEYVTKAGAEKSLYLNEGALIFANCGVSLGFARILKKAGCVHDGWLAFDEINPSFNKIFLLKWLNQLTSHFRKIAPDGTQPNLNTGIMKQQELICPPVELQERFENIVHLTDSMLNKLKTAELADEQQFSAISQKAFSGQL